jgi:hypothetical protein
MRSNLIAALVVASVASVCQAQQQAPRLTNGQATTAVHAMIELDGIEVVLGTCKPAIKGVAFAGQTACTLLAVSQGGTSETQADFHWDGRKWVAAPSESQAALPFPDPVLADIHSGAKIDQNAGPIR